MTRLEELIHSFITVIIRFHDMQALNNAKPTIITANDEASLKEKTREYAGKLFRNKDDKKTPLKDTLNKIINEGTVGYPLRSSLFNYYLHEIGFLRSIIERTTPLSPKELTAQNEQLHRLFTDLKKLLNSAKKNCVSVKYSEFNEEGEACKSPLISINGLQYTTIFYNTARCKTGITLFEEVFEHHHIRLDCKDDQLMEIVSEYSREHENQLLVAELSKKNTALQQQVQELDALVPNLREQVNHAKESETKLVELAKEKESLEKSNEQLKLRVADLESRLANVESSNLPKLPLDFVARLKFPFASMHLNNSHNSTNPNDENKHHP